MSDKQKNKILWIDDEMGMLQPYVWMLEDSKYEVVKVGTLKEAIKRVEAPTEFQLAIVDLDLRLLPPGDGVGPEYFPYAGLKLAKDLVKSGRPVVVVSAYINQIEREELQPEGSTVRVAFVDKGLLSFENLLKAIKRVTTP